jgi:hypothetical protein
MNTSGEEIEMSEHQNAIKNAIHAIGTGNSGEDWRVEPSEHAKMFERVAPKLAEALRGARLTGLATSFEESDKVAIDAQRLFKSTVEKANRAVFATAAFGALLMVSGGLHALIGEYGVWIVRVMGLAGFIASGLGAMWLKRVQNGRLLNRWLETRARAEAKRLKYFKTVLKEAPRTAQDKLNAFEYVRRFLLDNQLDYFKERRAQHEKADSNAINKSTLAVFLSSTFTAIAGFLSILQPELALLAGLGAVATAYGAMKKSQSEMNLDSKNALRYAAAGERLFERNLELDDYRKRIAEGVPDAVEEFFEPIFVTLEADHQAFLSQPERRELAIGNMEKRLDAASEVLQNQ